jgi:hypothetical protein
MEPALADGDRVEVVSAAASDFEPGDIMVFRAGDELVVHRLLRKEPDGFFEMGDNRALAGFYPWPARMGRVTRVLRPEGRIDLETPDARSRGRAIAARSLRRHRAERLAQRIPGRFLPRLVRAVVRRVFT